MVGTDGKAAHSRISFICEYKKINCFECIQQRFIHFEFLIKINSEFSDYTLKSIIDTGIFRTSHTIGYVRAGGTGTATGTDATLPNPFASHEQITERITTELRRVISEAESYTSQGQHVEIKCDFGMTLDEMRCHHGPLPQAGQ